MLSRIAWRNIIVNKKRSGLTILLNLFSAGLVVIYVAMMDGMYGKMISDGVEMYKGYLQVSGAGYQETPSYEHLLYGAGTVQKVIENAPEVADWTARLESFALYASDTTSVGGAIVGILPDREGPHSWLERSVEEGRWLRPDDGSVVYLGEELAKKLEVTVGDTISYVSNAVDYSFTADNLEVVGTYKTGLTEFDASFAFVAKGYMDRMFMAEDVVSYFVVRPRDTDASAETAQALRKALKGTETEVVTWRTLIEDMLLLIEVDRAGGIMMVGVFYVVILFVIMIYSMIAIFARTREIGIMRAVGTRPVEVMGMLMMEAFILALIGSVVGGAIGGGLTLYWEHSPIYLSGYEEIIRQYAELGMKFDPYMYTKFSWFGIITGSVTVFVMNLIAVFYPAWRVGRMRPVDAINYV